MIKILLSVKWTEGRRDYEQQISKRTEQNVLNCVNKYQSRGKMWQLEHFKRYRNNIETNKHSDDLYQIKLVTACILKQR